jgi:hypothetical protein
MSIHMSLVQTTVKSSGEAYNVLVDSHHKNTVMFSLSIFASTANK